MAHTRIHTMLPRRHRAADGSINRIGKLAWDAIKTDFTEAEQEERRLLLAKVSGRG